MERWKNIKGYEGRYQISSKGRVRSLLFNKTKIMKNIPNAQGYLRVLLYKPLKNFRIHRLVAIAFIPNPKNLPEVNHKNGKKWDNRKSNLEWCTKKENAIHSKDNGLIGIGIKKSKIKLSAYRRSFSIPKLISLQKKLKCKSVNSFISKLTLLR